MEHGVAEVRKGTDEAALSGSALAEILTQIDAVNSQMSQIATARDQQTATTREISENIVRMKDALKEAAQGVEASTSSASDLAVLAKELQVLVGQFKLE